MRAAGVHWSALFGIALCACATVPGCAQERADGPYAVAPSVSEPAVFRATAPRWREDDWQIFAESIRAAEAVGVRTMPIGAAVATVGRRFIGAPYTPGTLDPPGPERLVINLREFDCVTFVEQVLALVAFARRDGVAALADTAQAQARFAGYLQALRYRDGQLNGYASRLHYFSEWLAQQAAAGRLRVLGDELRADLDARPISFMSTHVTSYRALADSGVLADIRRMEQTLGPRRMIPKARVREVEPQLREGDLLAMTSTLDGLDVAHVGFVVLLNGRPHLLNAPLVGKSVEVSPLPLHEHLAARSRQSGMIVARLTDAP